MRYFHLAMMALWAALSVPTILWWRDSVLVVLIFSLYANFGTHFAAYQAACAEHRNRHP